MGGDTAWWTVPRLWEGERCWIIGGGLSAPRQFGVPEEVIREVVERRVSPSQYGPYYEPLHNERVIGVNNAYQIGVWIDALFFGDCSWYLAHRKKLIDWPGIKATCCPRFLNKPRHEAEGIKYLAKHSGRKYGISNDPCKVSWNSNSGAAAISLAAHLGVKQIILLGFDMALSEVQGFDGKTKQISHFHGNHRQPNERAPTPPFKRHLKGFARIREDAEARGIEILNASPESSIKELKKVEVKELLG